MRAKGGRMRKLNPQLFEGESASSMKLRFLGRWLGLLYIRYRWFDSGMDSNALHF